MQKGANSDGKKAQFGDRKSMHDIGQVTLSFLRSQLTYLEEDKIAKINCRDNKIYPFCMHRPYNVHMLTYRQ